MINNIAVIKSLLVFDSEDDFYHLQILKRKKDNPGVAGLSNSYVVKTYYIRSVEYLEDKYEEIQILCKHHNARACINLNKRSFERVAFHTLKKVTDQILNKDFKSVRKAYESVCGTYSSDKNKKWILDFDTKEDVTYALKLMQEYMVSIAPQGEKFLARIPTKNGFHIITKPFDVEAFQGRIAVYFSWTIDIHKDNPTILYIP